jgi:hypothetical protein
VKLFAFFFGYVWFARMEVARYQFHWIQNLYLQLLKLQTKHTRTQVVPVLVNFCIYYNYDYELVADYYSASGLEVNYITLFIQELTIQIAGFPTKKVFILYCYIN